MICGNPFNILTGNKVEQEYDFVGTGRLPLTFSRTINSHQPAAQQSVLGAKWSMGIPRLEKWWTGLQEEPGGVWLGMILIREDGQRVKFESADGPLFPGTTNTTVRFSRTNGKTERLYQATDGTWLYFDRTMEYRFDGVGRITLIIDRPTGEYLNYVYTSQFGRDPAEIVHSSGRKLTLTYSQGRLSSLTDPAGDQITYAYNSRGNLSQVTYPATAAGTATKLYYYEDSRFPDRLTRMVDEAGVTKKWAYDASGDTIRSETNNGLEKFEVLSRTYANNQWQVRTRNALGKEAIHRFELVAGRKKSIGTDGIALGNCAAASDGITYDTNGYYDKITDREGNVVDYDHDANGRLAKITEAFGTVEARTTHFEHNFDTELLERIENVEQKIVYDYGDPSEQGQGRLKGVVVTDKTGGSPDRAYTFTYPVTSTTPEGTELVRQVFVDGPRPGTADTTKLFYDSAGRLVSILDAGGHLTQFTNYDAEGRARTITYPSGMVTNLVFNARGWLTSKTDVVKTKPIGSAPAYYQHRTTNYTRRIDGALIKVTFPDNTFLQYFYDDRNRVKRIDNSLEEFVEFTRDSAGNITSERIQHYETVTTIVDVCCNHFGEPIPTVVTTTEAVTDKLTTYNYDALSRLEKITDGNGDWSLIRYNKNDLVELFQDARGYQTTRQYNQRNELEAVLNPDGGSVAMTYDDNALLETVTDAIGVTTTYTRNGFGDAEQEYSPDAGAWDYEYDEAGTLKRVVDARGFETVYHYDALNRIDYIDHPSGPNTVFTYDPTSGWLTQVTDDSGSTSFQRDDSGAITRKQSVVDGEIMTIDYQYDVMGRVEQTLMPGGTRLYYEYDDAGRVSRIRASHPSFSIRDLASNITYKPFGPLTGVTLGSSQVRALDYDDNYQLTQLVSANQIHKSYSYDSNGNTAGITNGSGYGNRYFLYDEMDRLDYHSGSEGAFASQFDDNGNLTQRVSSSSETYTYYAGTNRLHNANGSYRHYDTNGNTTRRGPDYLTYDDRNRLSNFHKWTGHVNTYYRYNAFGERVQKYRSGFDQKFLYESGGRLTHERGAQGTVDYVYLNGEPIAMVRNGSIYYLHTDHLGRPLRAVTETNSFTVWSGDDRPWNTGPGSTYVDVNLRFPGQYYDEESGLYYNYFRYYDPEVGRYLTNDPIGLYGGLNRFAYAQTNPVTRVDPYGLESVGIRQDANVRAWARGDLSDKEFRELMIGDPLSQALGGAIGCAVLGSLPIVGNYMDFRDAWHDPSWQNILAAGAGVAGPLGKALGRGIKATKVVPKSVQEAGEDLAKTANRNRVSARTAGGKQVDIDLAGKAHFDKATGQSIPTPHVREATINTGPNGKTNLSDKVTRPATMEDFRTARKILERE